MHPSTEKAIQVVLLNCTTAANGQNSTTTTFSWQFAIFPFINCFSYDIFFSHCCNFSFFFLNQSFAAIKISVIWLKSEVTAVLTWREQERRRQKITLWLSRSSNVSKIIVLSAPQCITKEDITTESRVEVVAFDWYRKRDNRKNCRSLETIGNHVEQRNSLFYNDSTSNDNNEVNIIDGMRVT